MGGKRQSNSNGDSIVHESMVVDCLYPLVTVEIAHLGVVETA